MLESQRSPSSATAIMIRLFAIVALLTGLTSWAVSAHQTERLSEPDLVGTWKKVSSQDYPIELRLEFFDDQTFDFELNNVCSSTRKTYHMEGTWRQRRRAGLSLRSLAQPNMRLPPRALDDLISDFFLDDGHDWQRLQFLGPDRIRLWGGEYVRERSP